MELWRKEERCGDCDSPGADAVNACSTTRDLIRPERQPSGIGLTIEKVEIVLAHEERRFLNRVGEYLAPDLTEGIRRGMDVEIQEPILQELDLLRCETNRYVVYRPRSGRRNA